MIDVQYIKALLFPWPAHLPAHLIILGFVLTTMSAPAYGDEKHLSLSSAIQEALRGNPTLKSAEFAAEADGSKIGPAGAYPDPKLAFEFSNYPEDSLEADQTPMTGRELRLSQKFPFPGKLTAKRESAEYLYQSSRSGVEEKRQQLVFQVKQAYYQLFLAHKKIEIVKNNEKTLMQFVRDAETRYSIGKGLQQDVLQAHVKRSEVKKQLIILESQKKSRESALNVLLFRPPHQGLPTPDKVTRTKINFANLGIDRFLNIAVKSRPALAATRNKVQGAQSMLDFEKKGYFPDFELGVKRRLRQPNMADDGDNFVSAFVGLSLPVYFFSKQSRRHDGAIATLSSAKAQESAVQQKVKDEIFRAYTSASEGEKILDLYEKSLLPQAEQHLKAAKQAYMVDKVDFLNLLVSETALFNHRINYYQSLVDYQIAIAALEANTGRTRERWHTDG